MGGDWLLRTAVADRGISQSVEDGLKYRVTATQSCRTLRSICWTDQRRGSPLASAEVTCSHESGGSSAVRSPSSVAQDAKVSPQRFGPRSRPDRWTVLSRSRETRGISRPQERRGTWLDHTLARLGKIKYLCIRGEQTQTSNLLWVRTRVWSCSKLS